MIKKYMNQKTFNILASIIFGIVCILHFGRALLGWEMLINGWIMPIWISWLAFVILAVMAYHAFKLRK